MFGFGNLNSHVPWQEVGGSFGPPKRAASRSSIAFTDSGAMIDLKRLFYGVLLAAAPIWGGCGDPSNRNAAMEPENAANWTVASEPITVVGLDDSRPGHQLRRVVGAALFSNGSLAVADGAAATVSFFDDEGRLIETVGGPGEDGPTEFGVFDVFIRTSEDTLRLLSHGQNVVTITAEGSVTKHRVQRWPTSKTCRVVSYYRFGSDVPGVTPVADTVLLVEASDLIRHPTCPSLIKPESVRGSKLLARFNTETGSIDTLGIFPGDEWTGYAARFYGRDLRVAVSPNRIFAGDTGSNIVEVYSREGEHIDAISLPLRARAIPEVARPERSQRHPMLRGEGEYEAYDYPSLYPVFARLMADVDDNLWVMDYPEVLEPTESLALASQPTRTPLSVESSWLVFSPEGDLRARVDVPEGLYVTDVGRQHLVALSRDDLGVEVVRLFSIRH